MMKLAWLLLASPLLGQTTSIVFENCTITQRHSLASGVIHKQFTCSHANVDVAGIWEFSHDDASYDGYKEFGMWWSGEREDFALPAKKQRLVSFTKCDVSNCSPKGMCAVGGRANYDGYMTEESVYHCAEGDVLLRGMWGDEYQGHWEYHLTLGEVDNVPSWSDDVEKEINFISGFQKWCKTPYGYRLCGWINQPKIDHGSPPAFKRDSK